MKRRSLVITAMALAAVVVILFFWARSHREPATVRIVAVLPLTGIAAQWGIPPRDAAFMAVGEVNAKGGIKGRKLVLQVQDSKCEPSVGVSAIQQLLVTERPIAILGAVCSSVTLAIAPIVERNKVVLISPASTNPLITQAGDHVFRVIPSDALRGEIFARYVYSLGHRNVSLLYINNEGGAGNQKSFSDSFRRLGGTILSSEAYPQDARDVRAQITKIRQEKPDAIVVVSYPDDTPLVLRQMKELGLNVPLFFQTEALDDPTVIQRAGNAAEGVTYILPAKPSGSSVNSFAQRYEQRYGKAPELYAAEGYDIVMLIASILSSASELSSEALKAGLYRTRDYRGASGVITFDQNGDVTKPMAIKRIESGATKVIKTID